MTKSKNTKRALFASVLSMLLCMAMLIGSTFAWFTDTVTTGRNKIVAGNLDVALQYSTDGESWAYVDETTTDIFKADALWEPGYTEVVYLKVENKGNLALKYQFGINVVDETPGRTAKDETINLADFIEFGVVETETKYGDRTVARDAVKESAALISEGYSSAEGHLTAGSTSKMLALVVYMPEDVSNNANHGPNPGDAPSIDIGIELVATQDTVEKDSFDEKYDQYAVYPDAVSVKTVEELKTAITEANDGDVIALAENMNLEAPMTINKDITISGNGKEISGKPITAAADVSFKNVKLSKPENASNSASLVYAETGCESLTFEGCTFSDPQWEAIQATSKDLKTVTVTNCTFTAADVNGAGSDYNNDDAQAIRFIHVQPSGNPIVNIMITNNTFKDCNKVKDSVVGIYYVSTDSTITVGGNKFEGWAEGDVVEGVAAKLSVGWPEVEELKTVSNWEGENQTFKIDKDAPTINP